MTRFIGEVSHDRWLNAQQHELATWKNEPADGEDWNSWWATAFDDYQFMKDFKVDSILEVGCGPYAKNLELFIRAIGYRPSRILLEDPLIQQYVNLGKSIRRFVGQPNVTLIPLQMEVINFQKLNLPTVDVVLCNNVLDHVESVSKCFEQMWNALSPGGILVFGQDLSSEEDLVSRDPKAFDEGCHPIVIDEKYLEPFLSAYTPVFRRSYERGDSRNPDANCGTLMFAGRKP
jgi:SAM-dependent methyltransferase